MIKQREFVKTNELVWKIGRSRRVLQRISSYAKGSVCAATIIVSDNVKAEKILIKKFKAATDLCWQNKEMGREYFVAHSRSCELSLIDLFYKVAIRIMKEQFGPLLKTNPHKSSRSRNNEDEMTSSSSSDYGTDKEDNDKNNDDKTYDNDETYENGKHDRRSLKIDSTYTDDIAPSDADLTNIRDPYNILSRFWRSLGDSWTGRSVSIEKWTNTVNAWAHRHGYCGPRIKEMQARSFLSGYKCVVQPIPIDNKYLYGFVVPSLTPSSETERAPQIINIHDIVSSFVNEFLVPDEKETFCLKDALHILRVRFKSDVQRSCIKDELQKRCGQCFSQKKVKGVNKKSVFVGYRLIKLNN